MHWHFITHTFSDLFSKKKILSVQVFLYYVYFSIFILHFIVLLCLNFSFILLSHKKLKDWLTNCCWFTKTYNTTYVHMKGMTNIICCLVGYYIFFFYQNVRITQVNIYFDCFLSRRFLYKIYGYVRIWTFNGVNDRIKLFFCT